MGNELVMYEKIADPVSAIERMGSVIAKSQMFGCRNDSQGQALVMMAMSDGVSITEMKRRYHIVNGKDLSMRADFMLAEFRRLGGEYTWVNDGDDGQQATIHLKYKTNDLKVSYTIEEAKQEGLIKDGSRWTKNPGSMLRARAQTKGVRMVCPEVLAGFPTDDEIDSDGHRQAVSPVEVDSAPSAPPATASATEKVTDAEFEAKDDSAADKPIESTTSAPCEQSQIDKIKTLLKQVAQMEGNADIGAKLKQKFHDSGLQGWNDLSYADAELLIQALSKRNVQLFFDAQLAGHSSPGEQS